MKTLLIMRHAKSSWDLPDLSDHDRPLNERGKRDAPRMGKLLLEQKLVPDLIVSSTAKRARKTAAKVAASSGHQGEVTHQDFLYHGDRADLVAMLRELPAGVECLLIVGHNPDSESLLESITAQYVEMPTAAVAHVELDIQHWQDLPEQPVGTLVQVWRPRELPD